MKQIKPIIFMLIILSALGLSGCSFGGGETGAADEATPIPPVIETSKIVSAEAFVVPVREVDLAFETGGRVIDMAVKEGEVVEAGQVLAQVNDADARAAVAIAEAALKQAQANLAQAKAGPTAEQIAVAQATIARAEANYKQVVAGPTEEEIATARSRVNTLWAQLNQVSADPQIESVRASMANVRLSEIDVAEAQREYDKIAYAADSDVAQPIARSLQRATLGFEASKANHDLLLVGATDQTIAVARAQLAEGQAALEQVLAGATPEQIEAAEIAIMEAEANLAQVLAGSTPEQIAVAEAGVAQAESSLVQAQLALEKLALIAPFNGIVADLNLEMGEIVAAGTPVVNLADFSVWRIETDDLTEIDIVRVSEGQSVDVRFDAIDEETFLGVVTRIKPRSETKAGDVTYTVIIDLDDNTDPRLRWGMTTFVEISVE